MSNNNNLIPNISNLNIGDMFKLYCRRCGCELDMSSITVGQYIKMTKDDCFCNDCKIDIRDNKINEILK